MAYVERFKVLDAIRVVFTRKELEEFQWSGTSSGMGMDDPCCPVCHRLQEENHHELSCWIRQALKGE